MFEHVNRKVSVHSVQSIFEHSSIMDLSTSSITVHLSVPAPVFHSMCILNSSIQYLLTYVNINMLRSSGGM
jgi:hypothetical protein